MKRNIALLMLVTIMVVLTSGIALAQHEEAAAEAEGAISGLRYLAAALAVSLSAIATGYAQSRIGSAGMGSIVEKPETAGTVIICVAIPETIVILGFVVAAMIIIM